MAKARARTTTRKTKDKWKAKTWYQIAAPSLFNNVLVAETFAESPSMLIGRITEVSLQDLTNDFRKSHIKLIFKVDSVEQTTAHTQFKGHMLTSDYLRRMIRRRKSRVDGTFDVETRDGALLRIKPFAIAEKRIQSSQKKLIRDVMKDIIIKEGKAKTLNAFIRDCLDGKVGSEIYKHCKVYYPVKRIEINKTEVQRWPTVVIEEEPPAAPEPAATEAPAPAPETPEPTASLPPAEPEPALEAPAPEPALEAPAEEEMTSEEPEEEPKKAKKAKAKKAKKDEGEEAATE
jgi:small subunit ribosomal protein S3Ae